MSPAPRVIRTTASNRFGNGVNRSSSANRRHRASGRLRTRLTPVPCGRGLTDAGRDLADAAGRELTAAGLTLRPATRDVLPAAGNAPVVSLATRRVSVPFQ